jgi:hypothetical protein
MIVLKNNLIMIDNFLIKIQMINFKELEIIINFNKQIDLLGSQDNKDEIHLKDRTEEVVLTVIKEVRLEAGKKDIEVIINIINLNIIEIPFLNKII